MPVTSQRMSPRSPDLRVAGRRWWWKNIWVHSWLRQTSPPLPLPPPRQSPEWLAVTKLLPFLLASRTTTACKRMTWRFKKTLHWEKVKHEAIETWDEWVVFLLKAAFLVSRGKAKSLQVETRIYASWVNNSQTVATSSVHQVKTLPKACVLDASCCDPNAAREEALWQDCLIPFS